MVENKKNRKNQQSAVELAPTTPPVAPPAASWSIAYDAFNTQLAELSKSKGERCVSIPCSRELWIDAEGIDTDAVIVVRGRDKSVASSADDKSTCEYFYNDNLGDARRFVVATAPTMEDAEAIAGQLRTFYTTGRDNGASAAFPLLADVRARELGAFLLSGFSFNRQRIGAFHAVSAKQAKADAKSQALAHKTLTKLASKAQNDEQRQAIEKALALLGAK